MISESWKNPQEVSCLDCIIYTHTLYIYIYMYICMCIYTYVHSYIRIHMYTYICTNMNIYIYVHIHIHVQGAMGLCKTSRDYGSYGAPQNYSGLHQVV